jgi:hypothetical protein
LWGESSIRNKGASSPLLHEYRILSIRLSEKCQEKNAKIMGLFGMGWDGNIK